MMKKRKVVSLLLILFFVFQCVAPINSKNTVFANSENGEKNSQADNFQMVFNTYDLGQGEAPLKSENNILDETMENPEGETETPGGGEVGPEGETETPGGGEVVLPEGETETPGGEVVLPEGETETPGGEGVLPEGETETPEDDTLQDEGEEELPAYELNDDYANKGTVKVPEDVDGNGIINDEDMNLISSKYNISRGQAGFDGRCDVNGDGIIDLYDLTKVSNKINTKPVMKGTVTADVLNVRRGPGTSHGVMGQLYYGNTVEILDDSTSGWLKVPYNNDAGYVSADYMNKFIEYIGFNPPSGGRIICIDPGHGGSDPGAIGPTGKREKDVTLSVGLKVRDLLQSYGYTVVMTRTGDYRLSEDLATDLVKRAQVANDNNADIFISIHANSFGNSTAHGTETYFHTREALGSKANILASNIQKELLGELGLYDRKVKQSNFSVLRNSTMPAALTELAFISNPKEEQLLITDEFQTKAARAIVNGILNYYK